MSEGGPYPRPCSAFLSFLPSYHRHFSLHLIFFSAYYHLDSASKRVKSLAGFDDSYYLVALLRA